MLGSTVTLFYTLTNCTKTKTIEQNITSRLEQMIEIQYARHTHPAEKIVL